MSNDKIREGRGLFNLPEEEYPTIAEFGMLYRRGGLKDKDASIVRIRNALGLSCDRYPTASERAEKVANKQRQNVKR